MSESSCSMRVRKLSKKATRKKRGCKCNAHWVEGYLVANALTKFPTPSTEDFALAVYSANRVGCQLMHFTFFPFFCVQFPSVDRGRPTPEMPLRSPGLGPWRFVCSTRLAFRNK